MPDGLRKDLAIPALDDTGWYKVRFYYKNHISEDRMLWVINHLHNQDISPEMLEGSQAWTVEEALSLLDLKLDEYYCALTYFGFRTKSGARKFASRGSSERSSRRRFKDGKLLDGE